MRLLLNIIWLIFGGLWLALGYAVAALIMFVLIITIPFGMRQYPVLRLLRLLLSPAGGSRPTRWLSAASRDLR